MEAPQLLPVQRFDIDWQMAKDKPLDFDLFLHLPLNQKYVCIRKKGQLLEPQKLKNLESLNFFVRRAEYQGFIKMVAGQLSEILTIRTEDSHKAAMLAARSLLKSTFSQEDPQVMQVMMGNLYNITSTIIDSVLETSNMGTKRAFRVLSDLVEKGTSVQKHPVNVAALAVLICYGVGYTTQKILYAVSVASLLHDIGLTKLPPEIAEHATNPEMLTEPQKLMLYSHPQLALEILKERGIKIPELAERMIAEHHESLDGHGYPKGLPANEINEMTFILKVADELDEQILAFDPTGSGLRLKLHQYFSEAAEKKRIPNPLLARVRATIL